MARIITHADIAAVPDGGSLAVPDGAQLTPLAEERARARGIALRRAAPPDALAQAVTQQVLARLGGPSLDAADADQVVREVLAALGGDGAGAPDGTAGPPAALDYCAAFLEQERARARRRAVITTTGKNGKGIVARLTAVIADLGGDILDISQTLVSDYFTMILIVDTATLSSSFADFKAEVEGACRDLSIGCMVMHEDVVTSLSRV
jgi:ACT domain-containing protein